MLAKSIRPLVPAVLGLVLALGPLPLLAQPREWQGQLNEQMLREYDCEVAFLSQVAERMVDGDLVVLAKVHCVDKRSFNAVRDSAFEPFEIDPCENPENRVC